MIAGHSHTMALLHGYDASSPGAADALSALEPSFAVTDQRGVTIQHRDFSADAVEHPQPPELSELVDEGPISHLVLMWQGNQLNVRALLLDGPVFDVMVPGEPVPQPDERVEYVPCAAVESYIRQTLEGDEILTNVLDRAGRRGLNVALLGPPPPLPESAVRERLAASPHFAHVMREKELSVANAQIVPDAVRRRMRTILLGVYRRFAHARGAAFLPPPDESADANGMLRAPYWSTDATHGNAAYGELYLRHVAHWIRKDARVGSPV